MRERKLYWMLVIKILLVILALIWISVLIPMCLADAAYEPNDQKERAHEIAEMARSLGLPESDPIIVRAKELWHEADEEFQYDRDLIATVIYNEAWGGCTDRHKELVGAVVLNRVNSSLFPDTVYDVIAQPGQYHIGYVTPNHLYYNRARANEDIWKQCQALAAKALRGEVECDPNVVFQANFKQGKGVYEVCYTSYSVSYFCYT